MKHDEMLRFYQSPEGLIVVRFGDKCFISVDAEGNYRFLAIPDCDSRHCAEAVVKKWRLERTRTINIDIERAVESVMWLQKVNKKDARRVVSESRKLAHGLVDAVRPLVAALFGATNIATATAEPDPLDAEFIGE